MVQGMPLRWAHMNALTGESLSVAATAKCRRALDLVYALVNEGNIKQLTRELLDYLKISDAEFKPDLTSKICQLVQRFAPDKRWHFDSTLQVLSCCLPESLLHPAGEHSEISGKHPAAGAGPGRGLRKGRGLQDAGGAGQQRGAAAWLCGAPVLQGAAEQPRRSLPTAADDWHLVPRCDQSHTFLHLERRCAT